MNETTTTATAPAKSRKRLLIVPLAGLLVAAGVAVGSGADFVSNSVNTANAFRTTARDGELDRVVGLDVGADDYIAKPFALAELLARLRALLRRSAAAAPVVAAAPQHPDAGGETTPIPLVVDVEARRVFAGERELALSTKEFDLLAQLDGRRGAVVTRERLMDEVWDENWFGSTKTLDVTVARLRQKLEESGADVRITTLRGVGFRLDEGLADA